MVGKDSWLSKLLHRRRRIGQKKRPTKLGYALQAIAALLFAGGLYVLWLTLAQPIYIPAQPREWNNPVPEVATVKDDRLYIPKLKLNVTYKSGGEEVLLDNVWHRFAERGDPEKGGNFILAGHRFEIGLTPGETRRKSPFYNIDKLAVGDDIYADFNGKRYKYQIIEHKQVKPTQVEIEAPSVEPKMTLYTCTLGGEADGREVYIAHLVAKDVDPKIKF